MDIDPDRVGTVLATADPPDHTRQRKVVTRRLSTTVMQDMEPEFRDLVDQTLDAALPTGRIEWMSQLAEPLPMIMVARILGLPDDAAPRLKEQGYASVEAISGFVSEERLAELGQPMMDVGPVVDAYLEARGAHHYDTERLIGVCGQAVEAGELTDEEALAILFLLVSAGGESTTSLTGTGVRILAERPTSKIGSAANRSSSRRSSRRRVGSIPVPGPLPARQDRHRPRWRQVPAGSTVVLAWTAANHDADAFPNPDDIDLDRPIRVNMSVSAGASTSASARPSPGSKRRSHSSNCSPAPSPSRSNRRAHRCVTI